MVKPASSLFTAVRVVQLGVGTECKYNLTRYTQDEKESFTGTGNNYSTRNAILGFLISR